jgi:hypothetical protein
VIDDFHGGYQTPMLDCGEFVNRSILACSESGIIKIYYLPAVDNLIGRHSDPISF